MKKNFLKTIIIAIIINLLAVASAPHVHASKNTIQPSIKYYCIKSDVAPIRSGPGKHFPKIAEMEKWQIVGAQQILKFRGQRSRWAKFKYLNYYTAYINLKHLSKKSPVVS